MLLATYLIFRHLDPEGRALENLWQPSLLPTGGAGAAMRDN